MVAGTKSELVKADQTMLALVQALHDLEEAGVTELAEYTGRAKSTVYKHLQTLHQEQYVIRDGNKYRLGYRFLYHGGAIRDNSRLFGIVEPEMRPLAEELEKPIMFAVKERERGVYVYHENPKNVSLWPVGTYFYLHTTAGGKAMLSVLSDEEIEEYIRTVGLVAETENTITDEEALFSELEEIREQGYSTNVGERVELNWGLATPLRDDATNTVAALCMGWPADRILKDRIHEESAPRLLEVRSRVRRQLELMNE